MIHSKLHKVLEVIDDCPLKADLQRDPLYIFDDHLLDILIQGTSSTKSMIALAEVSMLHLPYPKMTVQWNSASGKGTWFISLRERDNSFYARSAFLFRGTENVVVNDQMETVVKLGPQEFEITSSDETVAMGSAIGTRLAVLMIHVAGLDREIVEPPEKLNKQRLKSNKPPVQRYSYVHVSKVYDSSGKAHAYTGRHMPIHMRAGHVRRQHHGKDNEEVKLIWIAPVLVNYKGDEIKPIIEKRIVA